MTNIIRFSDQVHAIAERMQRRAEETNARTDDHWIRPRSLAPDSAALLYLLARTAGAKRVLEIGTSVGFSTLHLAYAVSKNGGKVTTVEFLEAKQSEARQNIQDAGLADYVEFILGDAREVTAQTIGPWDLVFIDLEKDLYLAVWNELSGAVASDGVVVADNVISHASDIEGYLAAVRADDRYETVTVPIGQGLEVSRRL